MKNNQFDYFDILQAKKSFKEGGNITDLLKAQKNVDLNTAEIIETAYDLQAGSYIEYTKNNPILVSAYTTELAVLLEKYIGEFDSLLDIGTGELTTLSQIIRRLKIIPKKIYAFDISWSRIYKGLFYAEEFMGMGYKKLMPFVADLNEIPLLNKSINITTSSHALEPNGGNLKEIMNELFRITIDKLVLFEPCFEINTKEGQERMEKLGYIKNVDKIVEELGGKIIEKIAIKNIANPLNPTVCFVITPPLATEILSNKIINKRILFSVPGTNIPLEKSDDNYFSKRVGLCYPTLKGIPVLKSKAAILASSFGD